MPSEIEIPLHPNNEYSSNVFDKYDKDNDGYLSLQELNDLVRHQPLDHAVSEDIVARIHSLADRDASGHLDFNEFLSIVNHPYMQPIIQRLMNRYIHVLVPRNIEITRVDGQYEDEYTCCPPPFGMILISIIEIIFYCIDEAQGSTMYGSGPMANIFIYNPHRRYEAWRFITYMFVHIGLLHLIVNLCVQILLGIPLEMVHRWWRVLVIYFAGVLAGSLCTSITDPRIKLAGASGGVYALMTAHISTIIMNWREMEYPLVQLLIFVIITGSDVGKSIYDRYVLDINANIGYAAHFAGAVAGLLVGINLLRNLNVTRKERVLWWFSIITYITLMCTAIVWNIAFPDYFPTQNHGI